MATWSVPARPAGARSLSGLQRHPARSGDGWLARAAEVFLPSWIHGEPFAGLVKLTYGIRVAVGAAALAFSWALPVPTSQKVLHASLVGLVYLPWAFGLLLVSRRTEGPALRLAALMGDVLVIFMFMATIPAVQVAGMMGFVLLTTYYSLLGGRTAGLAVGGAALGLTLLAQAITGTGVEPYIHLMYGSVLVSEVALLHSVSRHQREAARELHEVDRLKDEFLASISHELRTPLTSIDGFSQTLLRKWEHLDETERLEFVELIEANSQDLTHLIEQLLDYSRLQAKRLEVRAQPLDLATAVAGCVEALDPVIGAARVKIELEAGWVSADPNALRRVLSNLLMNAATFSPGDAPIIIGAATRGLETVIWVRDEGPGVPAPEHTRVFDPFFQGKGERHRVRGTGVALAVARRYVEAQGGRIWVEDTPGGGATFLFTLPSAAQSSR